MKNLMKAVTIPVCAIALMGSLLHASPKLDEHLHQLQLLEADFNSRNEDNPFTSLSECVDLMNEIHLYYAASSQLWSEEGNALEAELYKNAANKWHHESKAIDHEGAAGQKMFKAALLIDELYHSGQEIQTNEIQTFLLDLANYYDVAASHWNSAGNLIEATECSDMANAILQDAVEAAHQEAHSYQETAYDLIALSFEAPARNYLVASNPEIIEKGKELAAREPFKSAKEKF